MVAVDIQKLIAEKVRFQVDVEIRLSGYVDGKESHSNTVAHVKMQDLTKQEAEMAIGNVVEVLDWIADKLEPEE